MSDISNLPWLDPTCLTADQLAKATVLFDDLKDKTFKAVGLANSDAVRMELDRRLLVDILELPKGVMKSLEKLRTKWCLEPSVRAA